MSTKNAVKKRPDYSNYKFDTSKYVIIDSDVKRDKDTGKLISISHKKKSEAKI